MLLSRGNTCPSWTLATSQAVRSRLRCIPRHYPYCSTNMLAKYLSWLPWHHSPLRVPAIALSLPTLGQAHKDLILGNELQKSVDPLLRTGIPCIWETHHHPLCTLVWSEHRESSRLVVLAWLLWILSVAGIKRTSDCKLQPKLACQALLSHLWNFGAAYSV